LANAASSGIREGQIGVVTADDHHGRATVLPAATARP